MVVERICFSFLSRFLSHLRQTGRQFIERFRVLVFQRELVGCVCNKLILLVGIRVRNSVKVNETL